MLRLREAAVRYRGVQVLLDRKAKGRDRITHRDWEDLSRLAESTVISSGTPGMTVQNQDGGTRTDFMDPKAFKWVFVVGIREDGMILAREAIDTIEGWRVYLPNEFLIVAKPSAN